MIAAGVVLVLIGVAIAYFFGPRDATIRTIGIVVAVIGIGLILWDALDIGNLDDSGRDGAALLAPMMLAWQRGLGEYLTSRVQTAKLPQKR